MIPKRGAAKLLKVSPYGRYVTESPFMRSIANALQEILLNINGVHMPRLPDCVCGHKRSVTKTRSEVCDPHTFFETDLHHIVLGV